MSDYIDTIYLSQIKAERAIKSINDLYKALTEARPLDINYEKEEKVLAHLAASVGAIETATGSVLDQINKLVEMEEMKNRDNGHTWSGNLCLGCGKDKGVTIQPCEGRF